MKRNSMKRIAIYLIYSVVMISIISLGFKYQNYLDNEAQQTYKISSTLIFAVMFPLILGILFSVPSFYRNFRKHGTWKIDWVKLCIIGIPTLYIVFIPLLMVLGLNTIKLPFAMFLFNSGQISFTISGLVFGYLLLGVFEKNN
ncbi:hypothetical protein [Paenibacillus andongensis]|uniref:hypothetical protein n=1 Tax=Paenibacillus andongensis TaxID=2975482 RepID=UPI0021BAAA46|nr:hypothetical protein [Paenibacillus andongensis]